MKIYYNFDEKHRNFSLAPSGPLYEKDMSYPHCVCIDTAGKQFNIYVIIYEDGMGDYINGNDPTAMTYYNSVRTKMGNNLQKIKNASYYKFGYHILDTSYEIDGTLFIETQWTKE
jgi:hypothetical protein